LDVLGILLSPALFAGLLSVHWYSDNVEEGLLPSVSFRLFPNSAAVSHLGTSVSVLRAALGKRFFLVVMKTTQPP